MQTNIRRIQFLVDKSHDGNTVLSVLIKNNVSKRLITRLKQIENGITLNGIHARTIDTVKAGDIVEIALEDEKVLIKNSSLVVPVVYDDEDVIVFNKPAFMAVHPSLKHIDDTLGNFFASHCEGLTFRPINRLDRDTSGLCVVAKNRFSAVKLQASLEKIYYAVACGSITEDGTIDAPIARVDNSIITRCVREDGQRAVTHYEIVSATDNYTLLKVKLETGRTHQIRVHFSYIGHPLAGDDMYGGDLSHISRQALHCKDVSFIHPVTCKMVELSSDLPADINSLFSI